MIKNTPKVVLTLILVSVIVKFGVLIFNLKTNPHNLYFFDSWGYCNIAENLYNSGVYSQVKLPNPLLPDSMRPPLYPFLLYLLYQFQLQIGWLIGFQILLSGMAVWIFYQITQILDLNLLAAKISTAFLAFDLPTIFFTNTVLTDGLFQSILIFSFWFFLKYLKNKSTKWLLYFLIVYTLGVYLKPIGMYLPLILVIILWAKQFATKQLVVFTIFYFVLLTPWYFRNYVSHQAIFYSTVVDVNIQQHVYPAITKINFISNKNLQSVTNLKAQTKNKLWFLVQKHPIDLLFFTSKNALLITIKPIVQYWEIWFNKNYKPHILTLSGILSLNFITKVLVIIQLLMMTVICYFGLKNLKHIKYAFWPAVYFSYFVLASSISVTDARFRVAFIPFMLLICFFSNKQNQIKQQVNE